MRCDFRARAASHTLLLASRRSGVRMHRREWGAAMAMTKGLVGLL
jgi:hypothetical protein